tara:strand:- start:2423 stop:2698 length:276 start_codon:yes stop_codon:yes gene_type:complete
MATTHQVKQRSKIQTSFQNVFDTPQGKEVLYHLIKHQGVLKPAHARGNTCCDTAHQDGRRAVVLDILHFINVDPSYFERIVEEMERETYDG